MANNPYFIDATDLLRQLGSTVGSALGSHHRNKEIQKYEDLLSQGNYDPKVFNNPLGKEVLNRMAMQQLYGPIASEGGFDTALDDLQQRMLAAHSLNTPEGQKQADLYNKMWHMAHEQNKSYKEDLKNYHENTLKKSFEEGQRAPFYNELLRLLFTYQEDRDKNKFTNGLRHAFQQMGIASHIPITFSDIQRLVSGRALDLLDIKAKGGSNPSTVEFKAVRDSFINLVNNLEANLQILLPQAIEAQVAAAYYQASKKIKPEHFRSLARFQEALGEEAKKILEKDKEFRTLNLLATELNMNAKSIAQSAALTPLFDDEEDIENEQPLTSNSRTGEEERDVQPRDISSLTPSQQEEILAASQLVGPKPETSTEANLLSPNSLSPVSQEQAEQELLGKTALKQDLSNSDDLGKKGSTKGKSRFGNDVYHLLKKGAKGWYFPFILAWDTLVPFFKPLYYNKYFLDGTAADFTEDLLPFLPKEERKEWAEKAQKLREDVHNKIITGKHPYDPMADKLINNLKYDNLMDNVYRLIFRRDPKDISKWTPLLGELGELAMMFMRGRGSATGIGMGPAINPQTVLGTTALKLGTSTGKALAAQGMTDLLEEMKVPSYIAQPLSFLLAELMGSPLKEKPLQLPSKERLNVDQITPDEIDKMKWTAGKTAFNKTELKFTRELEKGLTKAMDTRPLKKELNIVGKSLHEIEQLMNQAYHSLEEMIKTVPNAERNIQERVVKEIDKQIANWERGMTSGASTPKNEDVLKALKQYKKAYNKAKGTTISKVWEEAKAWRGEKAKKFDPVLNQTQQAVKHAIAGEMTDALERSLTEEIPEVRPLLNRATKLYKAYKQDQFLGQYLDSFAGGANKTSSSANVRDLIYNPETERELHRIFTKEELPVIKAHLHKYKTRMNTLNTATKISETRRVYKGGGRESKEGRIQDYIIDPILRLAGKKKSIKYLGEEVKPPYLPIKGPQRNRVFPYKVLENDQTKTQKTKTTTKKLPILERIKKLHLGDNDIQAILKKQREKKRKKK